MGVHFSEFLVMLYFIEVELLTFTSNSTMSKFLQFAQHSELFGLCRASEAFFFIGV